MPYVNHYEHPLLDDIHNYFPAFLYEPEAFRSVGDLLGYVHQQTRRHFDRFSSAQHAYTASRVVPRMVAPVHLHGHGHGHGHGHTAFVTPPIHVPQRSRAVDMSSLTSQLVAGLVESTGQASIFEILGQLGVPTQQSMEPVVVRPTAEQINRGTAITVLEEEDVCAICQSEIAVGSEARSLAVCDHQFHPGCIETWFQRSVQCPVCRHDIRETSP